MTKLDFLQTMAHAYNFPDYFGDNLDSADEILTDLREAKAPNATEAPALSLAPFFRELLAEAENAEGCMTLLREHFGVE